MARKSRIKFSELPERLIQELAEHTYGGLLVFWLDSNGQPHMRSVFSEPADAIALQKFAHDLLAAMDDVSKEYLRETIYNDLHGGSPPLDDELPPETA